MDGLLALIKYGGRPAHHDHRVSSSQRPTVLTRRLVSGDIAATGGTNLPAVLERLFDQVRTYQSNVVLLGHESPQASHSNNPVSGYIPTLDGWRAIAIFGVMAFHCVGNGVVGGHIWQVVASRGYAGVDIFFALSGFLICGKLLSEQQRTKTIALKQFYLRRSFRILPALALYLAVLAVLARAGYAEASGWEFGSTLLYVRNYFPIFDGHPLGVYTSHLWTLAVEEHFYLIWPPIMLLLGPKLRRIGLVTLLLSLAVFVWRNLDYRHHWLIPFGSGIPVKTDTRIDALLWGCLAAVLYPYLMPRIRALPFGNHIWLPIVVILAAVLLLKHVPGSSLIKAIVFPAVIMSTAISPGSVLGRILEFGILKWIGRLSYSIYIWQQILIFPTISPNSPLRALQHFPVNIAFVFLFAAASYYSVERPMMHLGQRIQRSMGGRGGGVWRHAYDESRRCWFLLIRHSPA